MNQTIATEKGISPEDFATIARLNQRYIAAGSCHQFNDQKQILEELNSFYLKYPQMIVEITQIFSGPAKTNY